MKKLLSLTLALILVMLTFTASASGLFGNIVEEAQKREPKPLPSFSVFIQAPYDKTEADEEKVVYSYNNVEVKTFDSFGQYLEKQGYSVWDSNITGTTYILEIGLGMKVDEATTDAAAQSFVIRYDIDTLKLDTIYLAGSKIQEYAFLNTMPYAVKAKTLYTDSVKDQFGNTYAYSLGIDKGSVAIANDGKYTTFVGTIAFPGEMKYNADCHSASFVVNGNGKTLYESPDVNISTYPVDFIVNVTDCDSIEIVWSYNGHAFHKECAYQATIYNGMFY